MSNVTHITNRNILYLFAILVLMSIACSCGGLGFAVSEGMGVVNFLNIDVSSLHIAYQERPNGLFTIREPKPRSWIRLWYFDILDFVQQFYPNQVSLITAHVDYLLR